MSVGGAGTLAALHCSFLGFGLIAEREQRPGVLWQDEEDLELLEPWSVQQGLEVGAHRLRAPRQQVSLGNQYIVHTQCLQIATLCGIREGRGNERLGAV